MRCFFLKITRSLVAASALFWSWQAASPVARAQDSAAPDMATVTDELKGFWEKDDAKGWVGAVKPNSSQAVNYHDYPLMVDQIKLDEQARKEAQKSPKNPEIRPDQPAQEATSAKPTTPLSRDQIIAKYGAPDQPQPIRAQKDSPPAMQGLFEALNSGDKDLAWQYAVALARRQSEMQKTVSKATDYQILAMEALGMRRQSPETSATEEIDPTRAEVRDLMEQTRQNELQRAAPIDPEALQQADLTEGIATGTAEGALAAPQGQPAQAVKPPEIPVDPAGKVKILIFFDEKQSEAKQVAESLNPLKELIKQREGVSAIGLTKRTYSLYGLKVRGAELSFPFPLLSGEALALELRIQRYPTTVFVAATTKRTYRIEGVPSVQEMERVLRVMRGEG